MIQGVKTSGLNIYSTHIYNFQSSTYSGLVAKLKIATGCIFGGHFIQPLALHDRQVSQVAFGGANHFGEEQISGLDAIKHRTGVDQSCLPFVQLKWEKPFSLQTTKPLL